MTMHEFGHFFASILVHAQHISIHHNYTSNAGDNLDLISNLFIKGAGPLVSMIIGILFHLICAKKKKRNNLSLFYAYISINGYIGFFGYLIIAPWFPNGDTGYICYALGFPIWVTIILAIAASIVIYLLINSLMKYFVEMGSKEIIDNTQSREVFVRSLILFPLLIGIVVTTLLNLPIPVLISLIAPTCGSLLFLCGYESAVRKNYSTEHANKEFDQFNKLNIPSIIFFIITIIFNRLLVCGIFVN